MPRPADEAVVSLASAVPAFLAVIVFLAWAVEEGGYPPGQWLTGGVLLAVLLAISAISLLRGHAVRRVVWVALAALTAYGLFSVVSIAWAEVSGDAWEGGNRALLYAAVFALFALVPWTPLSGTLVVGAAAVGLAVVGFLVVASAAEAADPASYFVFRRLAEPTGYANATAALYLAPMFGALVLAARRELPAWARALLLGTAGTLLGLGLLPQSRASIGALAVTLVIVLGVARDRLRTLLAGLLVAAGTAPFAVTYLSVDQYEGVSSAELLELLADARNALVATFVLLFAAGLAWAWLEARTELSAAAVKRVGRRGVVVGAALVVCVGIAGALVVAAESGRAGESSHLSDSLAGGNRHDLWRVALLQFQDAPLLGAGADNFEADYLRERRSIDEPRHPHGLPFRALGQTGIIGTALLLAFVALAGCAAIAGARSLDRDRAAVALAGFATFAYWFVHGTVDWLWEFPALTGVALGSLALAGTIDAPSAAPVAGGRRTRLYAGGAVAAAVVLVAALLPPLLAQRQMTHAGEIWRDDPAGALSDLARARDLNPLSARADALAGAIAGRSGRRDEARAAYKNALERNPASWYSLLELAVLDYEDEKTAGALSWMRRARVLNPRDQILREVERVMRADERMNLAEIDGLFSRQLTRLRGKPSG